MYSVKTQIVIKFSQLEKAFCTNYKGGVYLGIFSILYEKHSHLG